MKSILDPSFKYTNAASTDLKKTFARIRRDIFEQKRLREQERIANVTPISALHREKK